jgi:hypothetical protein
MITILKKETLINIFIYSFFFFLGCLGHRLPAVSQRLHVAAAPPSAAIDTLPHCIAKRKTRKKTTERCQNIKNYQQGILADFLDLRPGNLLNIYIFIY